MRAASGAAAILIQPLAIEPVDDRAARQHGHEPRNAKLAGFFRDPVDSRK